MSEANPHNPYDLTIWDPLDPEQAIEDPMHGPEALRGLLAIPPMRNVDGSYYVFGASYVCGTNTFDTMGRPFIEFKNGMTLGFLRELEQHRKWVEDYQNGTLPPRDEMGLPDFQYNQRPYFKVQGQDSSTG